MSIVIWGQVLFVLASLCNGMLLMVGYDALRLFRWLLPRGKVWLWLEDTLYWCLASVPTFYLFFQYNDGVIRWYCLLGILGGAVLYEAGISLPVRSWLSKYADRLRRTLRKCRRRIRQWCGTPVRALKRRMEKRKIRHNIKRDAEKKKETKKDKNRVAVRKSKNKGLHKQQK